MSPTRLIAAAAALSLVALAPAGAAAKHKRSKAPPPPVAYQKIPPYWVGTPRPPWAQPWECFTDEGYGRYRPCSAGRR
ncbi:MAG: hypothetical protein WDO17_12160 [Alphaproteobacteria bacterium]